MNGPWVRQGPLSGLVAAAMLASGLASAPPALAVPTYTEADLLAYSNGENTSPTSCAVEENASPVLADVPIVDNGPTTALSTSSSGTITSNSDPSDVISFRIASTTTGRVTSLGGNPRVIELATSGLVQADTSKTTSACEVTAFSVGHLSLTFSVAEAGFLTVNTEADRGSYVQLYVTDTEDSAFLDQTGFGLKASGVTRVHLPPGAYLARLQANPYLTGTSTAVPSTSVNVSVKAGFAVAGSRTEDVSGAGKRYLTFPTMRSCATDSIVATVVDKRKRAKQIRKAVLLVNGRRVKTLTTPDKGRRVELPVADEVDALVSARVTLEPRRPGGKAKTHEVTVGYIACS